MIDKQIIDGVDVSGCEYCLKMLEHRCTIQHDTNKYLCEENPNCYYKQLKRYENEYEGFAVKYTDMEIALKRKTEELEQYKKSKQASYEATQKQCNDLTWENRKLKKECEELKKGLNLILTVQKNCKECPHQELDVDVLVCDLDCATAFKKIAKQTLKKLENKNV